MHLDAFRWLLTDDGQELLAAATEAASDGSDELAVQSRLRRLAAPTTSPWPSPRSSCGSGPQTKFGELAARMYFTPDGLEQATRLPVARHRAGRLRAASAATLIDLGCGIGGDLVAASAAGIITAGVDVDPVRVAIAEANLAALGLAGRGEGRRRDHRRHDPLRRGVRRSRTPLGHAAAPSTPTGGATLVVRRGPVAPRRLREGRPRHPARPGPGRRRGRVGQRPRRGQGGRSLVGSARLRPAPAPR